MSAIGHLVRKNKWVMLEMTSHSQVMLLMTDFNYPDISWRNSTRGTKHSRRFLEGISDNFLTQKVEEAMRKGALIDPCT